MIESIVLYHFLAIDVAIEPVTPTFPKVCSPWYKDSLPADYSLPLNLSQEIIFVNIFSYWRFFGSSGADFFWECKKNAQMFSCKIINFFIFSNKSL